jgi:hypothetical protein
VLNAGITAIGSLSEADVVAQAVTRGSTARRPADSARQPQTPTGRVDEAWGIDDGHALLAHRRAQCLEALDRWDDARALYRRACDLDAARFRAPGSFAGIVEEVAADAKSDLVHYLDTAGAFARLAPHGISGNESFLEHVHFEYAANWRMASIMDFLGRRRASLLRLRYGRTYVFRIGRIECRQRSRSFWE